MIEQLNVIARELADVRAYLQSMHASEGTVRLTRCVQKIVDLLIEHAEQAANR